MTTTTSTESPEKTDMEGIEESKTSENADTSKKLDLPKPPAGDVACVARCESRYYHQLTAISGGLFAGLLALMTFLLTVGYQRPHATFQYSLYASIGLLGLSVVMSVVANLFHGTPGHKIVRIIQQVVFVAAIVALVCLALATADFFFTIPAQPQIQAGQ